MRKYNILAVVLLTLVMLLVCIYHVKTSMKWDKPTPTIITNSVSRSSAAETRSLWTADEMLLFEYGERNSTVDDMYEPRLLDYIRSRVSIQSPSTPRRLQSSSPTHPHRSQIGQSQMVDELLKGRMNGFFIEAGAADGEDSSNSLFFELARNWTGLLVEANPDFHRQILQRNRRAFVLHACLGLQRRPMLVKMKMAHLLGGITTNETEDRNRFGLWYSSVANVTSERITGFPLISILAALGVTHVDYMSLDVEGVELEILKTIDFSRLRVDVFTVEFNFDFTKLKYIREFFSSTGIYREVAVIGNNLDVVYMRK